MAEIKFCHRCDGSISKAERGQFTDPDGEPLCEPCHVQLYKGPVELQRARSLGVIAVSCLAALSATVCFGWVSVGPVEVVPLKTWVGRLIFLGSTIAGLPLIWATVRRRLSAWGTNALLAWSVFALLFAAASFLKVTLGGSDDDSPVGVAVSAVLSPRPGVGLIAALILAAAICVVCRRIAIASDGDVIETRRELMTVQVVGFGVFVVGGVLVGVSRVFDHKPDSLPLILRAGGWPLALAVPAVLLWLTDHSELRIIRRHPKVATIAAMAVVIGIVTYDESDAVKRLWDRVFPPSPQEAGAKFTLAPISTPPAVSVNPDPPDRGKTNGPSAKGERVDKLPPEPPVGAEPPREPPTIPAPSAADLVAQRFSAAVERARTEEKRGDLTKAVILYDEALTIGPDADVGRERAEVAARAEARAFEQEVVADAPFSKTPELITKWDTLKPRLPASRERDSAERRIQSVALSRLDRAASRPDPAIRSIHDEYVRIFGALSVEKTAAVREALRKAPIAAGTEFLLSGDVDAVDLNCLLVPAADGVAFHRTKNPDAVVKVDFLTGIGTVERRDPRRLNDWDRTLQIQPTQGVPRLITASALQTEMEGAAPASDQFRTGVRLIANRLAVFGNDAYLNAGRWKRLGERNTKAQRVEWADALLSSRPQNEDDYRVRNFPNDGNEVTIAWVRDAARGLIAYGRVHLTERRPTTIRELSVAVGARGDPISFEVVPYKGRFALLALMSDHKARLLGFDEANGFRELSSGIDVSAELSIGNLGYADLNGDGKREYLALRRGNDSGLGMLVLATE